MPPSLVIDLNSVDMEASALSQDQIYEMLPHRHEFKLLHRVCHLDLEARHIVAVRNISADDWWFRAHVPGRPLVPGVLLLEMAAQASAILAMAVSKIDSFIAFGGVDRCKFREAVTAPSQLVILASGKDIRPRRVISETQGVVDGKLIFEATVTGLTLR